MNSNIHERKIVEGLHAVFINDWMPVEPSNFPFEIALDIDFMGQPILVFGHFEPNIELRVCLVIELFFAQVNLGKLEVLTVLELYHNLEADVGVSQRSENNED